MEKEHFNSPKNEDVLEVLRGQMAEGEQKDKAPESTELGRGEALEDNIIKTESGLDISQERQDSLLTELGGIEGVEQLVNSLSDKEKKALQEKIRELEEKTNDAFENLKTTASVPFRPDETYRIIRDELGSVFAGSTLPMTHLGFSAGSLIIAAGFSGSWIKNRISLANARRKQKAF